MDKGRVGLEWVSAAEGPRFVQVVTDFSHRIRNFGPVGRSEGVDRRLLLRKLEAARLATEGMKLRAAFAKQAREMKESSAVFPSEDKLRATLVDEMDIFETLLFLQKNKNDIAELAELLNLPAERVKRCIDTLGRRKIWSGAPYGNSSVNSSGS